MDEVTEIKTELQNLLDQHLKGHLGYIGQKSYKDNFFALFRRAYEAGYLELGEGPLLTEDALRDSLTERWISDLDESESVKAKELLEDLLRRWGEWAYALDQR